MIFGLTCLGMVIMLVVIIVEIFIELLDMNLMLWFVMILIRIFELSIIGNLENPCCDLIVFNLLMVLLGEIVIGLRIRLDSKCLIL